MQTDKQIVQKNNNQVMLPDEMWIRVFSYLGYKKLLDIQLVSKDWKDLARSNGVWGRYFKQLAGGKIDPTMYYLQAKAEWLQAWLQAKAEWVDSYIIKVRASGSFFAIEGAIEGAFQARKEDALARVRNNCSLLTIPYELRADKEVVMAAVRKDGFALQFASEELRADKDVVLTAFTSAIMNMVRAYNSAHKAGTLSGGICQSALQRPKRFFGVARHILDGGIVFHPCSSARPVITESTLRVLTRMQIVPRFWAELTSSDFMWGKYSKQRIIGLVTHRFFWQIKREYTLGSTLLPDSVASIHAARGGNLQNCLSLRDAVRNSYT